MAFGKKPAAAVYPPIEETEATYEGGPETMEYQGFIPQRYIRPITPHLETEHGQVENNVDRGTEAHGLYIDSHVHPQNAPELDYERTHDNVEVVNPQYEAREDKFDPINVRVVDQKPVELTRINIAVYPITGTTPVRILGQDDKRVRALVGTIGTVTGILVLLTDVNATPLLSGYPIPAAASTNGIEVRGDQELWASGTVGTDAGSVTVYSERIINGDSEHPSN